MDENQNIVKLTIEDEAAIKELLQKLCDAWECGDGEAYASLFYADARYIEAPGFRAVGREMIGKRHQKLFDTIFKFTRIDGKYYYEEIQPLTQEVVLIHLDGNIFFTGESGEKLKPNGRIIICVLKRNGTWKFISFQNTLTGKFRVVKFIWRFLASRIYMLGAEWEKRKKIFT